MKTLIFKIEIKSIPNKIWNSLWNYDNYSKWTMPFAEGCYYETSSFSEGAEINFLSSNGDGMLSKIVTLRPNEFVAFQHLGMITNGEKSFFKVEINNHRYLETYQLIQNGTSTKLIATVDTLEPWVKTMNIAFPKALKIVKEISEFSTFKDGIRTH